ncbi:MAG: tetratricopeptide repeat protein [Deltaproteobacteria bacterium]
MKNDYLGIKSAVLLLFFTAAVFQRAYSQGASKEDYDKLKKEYDTVVLDRDNVLAQIKSLLDYKNKYQEMESSIKKSGEEKSQVQKELKARLEQNTLLQQKIDELQSAQAQLAQDNESLHNSLEKLKIEYKMIPETRKEISRLQKENTDVIKELKQADAKVKRMEEQKLDADAQAESYRRQLNDFKKRYEEPLVKNRSLEKKVSQMPARFAELARENKILIKETALMHYNLGVFYTQNKEYSRSVAEFEKAIELNPDDPYAYYNLGYVYAEYLVNRPKAIEYFRQYLRLAKKEDKDVDWVKRYILTWQTWEGKKPAE